MQHKVVLSWEGIIIMKPMPHWGELARSQMGAGRHPLKPGAAPIVDLISERKEEDHLDQADSRR